jgi:hypothetical protein
MEKGKKRTRHYLGGVLLTICTMSILLGWIAYPVESASADSSMSALGNAPMDSPAIDKDVADVNKTAMSGSPFTQPSSGGTLPALPGPGISEVATQFMQQVGESIQSLLNSNTKSGFYGTGIEAAKAMVTRHFGGYCAGSETGNCPRDPLLQYGDVKVTSILSGTAYDGSGGPRTQAAQDYLTNLFVPSTGALVANFSGDLKNGTLDVDTVISDPKLLKKYTQALSDETLLSVPKQSFVEMMGRRTVVGSDTSSVSEMQLMEAEAIKRFMSAGWVQMIKNPATTPIQLQQEMAAMQAYQNWMAYQQFRQLERVEALLATLIVQSARSTQAFAASIPTGPSATDISNATAKGGSDNKPPVMPTMPTSP